ncbi:MAG: hypothetical protein MRY79_03615 [Alphaproteobacteria bacterium]|nr:hypothetical protein [Alphaproteobacteria bacterium]
MSQSLKNFLFVLLVPFFFAVGHDVYVNYFSTDEKIAEIKALRANPQDFLVSDLGWVWSEYSPATMRGARDAITHEAWRAQIDPILRLPTMVVASFPFFLGSVYSLMAFVLGVWPFARHSKIGSHKSDEYAVYRHAKSSNMKFKKK